jgi:hypothetical protein
VRDIIVVLVVSHCSEAPNSAEPARDQWPMSSTVHCESSSLGKGGGCFMKLFKVGLMVLVFVSGAAAISFSAGPPDERVRTVFKELLAATDTDKDGKLSVPECLAIYTDPAMADKNCKFWDVDHDGVITEDEYVGQVRSIGKK